MTGMIDDKGAIVIVGIMIAFCHFAGEFVGVELFEKLKNKTGMVIEINSVITKGEKDVVKYNTSRKKSCAGKRTVINTRQDTSKRY